MRKPITTHLPGSVTPKDSDCTHQAIIATVPAQQYRKTILAIQRTSDA